MPKAKPVSLFPLSFEEAINALIKTNPQRAKKIVKKHKTKKKM